MANQPVMKKRPLPTATAKRPAARPAPMVRRPAPRPAPRRARNLRPIHSKHRRVRGHLIERMRARAMLLARKMRVGGDLSAGWDLMGGAEFGADPDPYYGLGQDGAASYLRTVDWLADNSTDDRSDPAVVSQLVSNREAYVLDSDLILKSSGAMMTSQPPPSAAMLGSPSATWDAFLLARWGGQANLDTLTNAQAAMRKLFGDPSAPAPDASAPGGAPEKKSNLVWWLLGAAVVGGGAYLALRKR